MQHASGIRRKQPSCCRSMHGLTHTRIYTGFHGGFGQPRQAASGELWADRALSRAPSRHPCAHTNKHSGGLTHKRLLARLGEIRSAVTQHLMLRVKQEGRLGINVFSESCFPITKELCLSDVYRIACLSLSLSSHISSAREGVRKSTHRQRFCNVCEQMSYSYVIHKKAMIHYAESNTLSTNRCKGQVLIL